MTSQDLENVSIDYLKVRLLESQAMLEKKGIEIRDMAARAEKAEAMTIKLRNAATQLNDMRKSWRVRAKAAEAERDALREELKALNALYKELEFSLSTVELEEVEDILFMQPNATRLHMGIGGVMYALEALKAWRKKEEGWK